MARRQTETETSSSTDIQQVPGGPIGLLISLQCDFSRLQQVFLTLGELLQFKSAFIHQDYNNKS